ncbi:MAG: hypothetical protein GKR92_09190 [Gammaproteobacteria bacterium]|nr:MAG: hypothetical protein GKR92_09190 [Gammaproteobacteria bacterium]
MIRNIITAAILLAALVSMASIAQIASAVEPELNLDISAYKDNVATSSSASAHPFSWTPDLSQQARIIKLYEHMIMPNTIDTTGFPVESAAHEQRLISFEIYQGDGLDELRQRSKYHNSLTLPDEDPEAYGITVKQRF